MRIRIVCLTNLLHPLLCIRAFSDSLQWCSNAVEDFDTFLDTRLQELLVNAESEFPL